MKSAPILLGHNNKGDKPVHVDGAGRELHTYVVAGSGSGKTELLKILIDHDIRQGGAVVVIDAHTDVCEQVAHWPGDELHNRAVYLGPGLFPDATPCLNPFQLPQRATERVKEKLSNRMGELIGEICRGEGGASLSVRMITVAKACCRVLLDHPGATLRDLRDMLGKNVSPALLRAAKAHKDPEVGRFFREDWDAGNYEASRSAMHARLNSLLMHQDFLLVTCGNGHTPLYELVDEGKVVLFSLGWMGTATAEIVGKMVLCMISVLGDMRKETPRLERRPVHVYVDECQNFIGPAVIEILTQLRKYGVHLTLANQYLSMFPTKTEREAVLTCCHAKFLGAGGKPSEMAEAMGCNVDDVLNIPRRAFWVKWGDDQAKYFRARSDLADERARCTPSQWIARKMRHRPYYTSGDALASVVPGHVADVTPEGFSRELD